MDPLYRLREPSRWACAPSVFSHSSLHGLETCLLRWQLEHSNCDGFDRFPARPHPAAVEGDIVHQALDQLFKALALAGLPALDSPGFSTEVARFDLRGVVNGLVAEHEAQVARHPRGSGFSLRAAPQQLVNRVIRLFRSEYTAVGVMAPNRAATITTRPPAAPSGAAGPSIAKLLRTQGALSELRLSHPTLPFCGTIDLVRRTEAGAVVVDFKTGQPKPGHRDQVVAYALLWWRNSGTLPCRVEVRYPTTCDSTTIGEQWLTRAEAELGQRIERIRAALATPPAPARTGEHCRCCDVRQFCEAYWSGPLTVAQGREPQAVDLEVVIDGEPSATGCSARGRKGKLVTIVHAAEVGKVVGPFRPGESLRILKARTGGPEGAVELMPWTEVFHR